MGRFHGEGIFYENGIKSYVGNFENGLFEGEGESYYENGNLKYKGRFSKNLFNGKGELYYEF